MPRVARYPRKSDSAPEAVAAGGGPRKAKIETVTSASDQKHFYSGACVRPFVVRDRDPNILKTLCVEALVESISMSGNTKNDVAKRAPLRDMISMLENVRKRAHEIHSSVNEIKSRFNTDLRKYSKASTDIISRDLNPA